MTLRNNSQLSFWQTLYKDITDIRGLCGDEYNKGLLELTQYYKHNFPELMKK